MLISKYIYMYIYWTRHVGLHTGINILGTSLENILSDLVRIIYMQILL